MGDEAGTRQFKTFATFFSRGHQKMSPDIPTSQWSIFEKNLVVMTNFAGSKLQRMANSSQLAHIRFYIENG